MGAVLALVALLFTPTLASAATGTTTRVSMAGDGTQANDKSEESAVSADGRFFAFSSEASNLVPGDTSLRDVFVHDRQTASTTNVSVATGGAVANGVSELPDISADGRHVAFRSAASNLVSGDTNAISDIFVHDRQTGATALVSKASDDTIANDFSNDRPAISANGRFVAFESNASNLVAGDRNDTGDVFVHDRDTDGDGVFDEPGAVATTRVSVSSGPVPQEGLLFSNSPAISANGRLVAFQSAAPNLAVDTNGDTADVFVHDRQTATTTLVSKASDGTQASGGFSTASTGPAISGSGRFVSFQSNASNLVAGDTNGVVDTFVHDRQTGATARVNVASDGIQANEGGAGTDPLRMPAPLSGDGRYVVFRSDASNLVPGDTNDATDVFVHDRDNDADGVFDEPGAVATTRASVTNDGTEAAGESTSPDVSADASFVVFQSDASNLVSGDTNGVVDVFVRDRLGVPAAPFASVGDVAVHEGDSGTSAAVFTVSLSEPAETTVTVAYATAAYALVTGTAGTSDFTARSGTLSFAPGVTAQAVKVAVAGDELDEGLEAFTLRLSSPVGVLVGDGTGVGTIYDDDPGTGRRLAIGDVSVHEGDAGRRMAVFNVSISKASTAYVTVNFATAKGTAVGTDFAAKTGTLRFAPGTTSLNVKVAVTPDTAAEGNESFTVKLSSSSGPTIADATGVGTIVDND